MHYFIKQNGDLSNTAPAPASTTASTSTSTATTPADTKPEDTCLILIGSGAAFLDIPRGPIYPATKFAARGVMHSLRRTAHFYTSRVNVISPWYVNLSFSLSPSSSSGLCLRVYGTFPRR